MPNSINSNTKKSNTHKSVVSAEKPTCKLRSKHKLHTYEYIETNGRKFSTFERFGRALLGTIAVICTLGLALFSKKIRNLFTESTIKVRVAPLDQAKIPSKEIPTPTAIMDPLIDENIISEEELQQGISVSLESISKIETCFDDIIKAL